MSLAEIFKEEENFEKVINHLYNTEIKLHDICIKMEKQAKEQETKKYFMKLQKKSNKQIELLDELCEIYDISTDFIESNEINNLVSEAQRSELENQSFSITITDHELVQTAEKIKLQEEQYINNAVDLAKKLDYQEAIDILSLTDKEKYFRANFS